MPEMNAQDRPLRASDYGGMSEQELIAAYGGFTSPSIPGYAAWVRVGVLNGWRPQADLDALEHPPEPPRPDAEP